MIIIMIAVAAIGLVVVTRNKGNNSIESEDSSPSTDIRVVGTMEYERKYEQDTYFQGDMDNILYAYPFGKTESYECNKDIYHELTEEFKNMMVETATEYFDSMYGISPSQLAANYDTYVDSIAGQMEYDSNSIICMEVDGEEERFTPSSYASYLAERIIDSNLQMDVGVKTGSSMIYRDGSYKIRCLVTVKFYTCDDVKAIEDIFGISDAVMDIAYPLVYDVSIEGGKITGAELINLEQYQ